MVRLVFAQFRHMLSCLSTTSYLFARKTEKEKKTSPSRNDSYMKPARFGKGNRRSSSEVRISVQLTARCDNKTNLPGELFSTMFVELKFTKESKVYPVFLKRLS